MPSALRPVAKEIYDRLFRLQLRARIWYADRQSAQPEMPPAILRYRVCESLSETEFLRIGEGCADLIRRHVPEIDRAGRVLDFGCGCGRTIRWFLRDPGSTEFYGVDVDAEGIEWCQQHLPRGRFAVNAPEPPLPFPDAFFDVVYCLSVFTHLNEPMQDSWIAELARVLKPGGVLLLTVHGQEASVTLDDAGRAELERRGFLHRRSQRLRGIVPEWYHTTWHTKEYIIQRLAPFFAGVRYSATPGHLQDIVTARKI
jgi:SAM-dependent methyltransferase